MAKIKSFLEEIFGRLSISNSAQDNLPHSIIIDNVFYNVSSVNGNGRGRPSTNGTSDADLILGNNGHNILNGGDGRDIIDGKSGNDIIRGGNDDDYIIGNRGNDSLDGGRGTDKLSYRDLTSQRESVTLHINADGTSGSADVSRLFGNRVLTVEKDVFTGFEKLEGGSGKDTIDLGKIGTGGASVTADLGDSNGDGYFTINLTDKIIKTTLSSFENVNGGLGNDLLIGSQSANVLNGGAGNDKITGNGGGDTLIGGQGDDIIYAQIGDKVDGGSGGDTLILEKAGNVRLDEATGKVYSADTGALIFTATGIEHWQAGDGTSFVSDGTQQPKFFYATSAAENFVGTGDADTVSYERDTTGEGIAVYLAPEYVYLTTTGGFSKGDKFSNIENVIGSNANDTIVGNQSKNILSGGYGDDWLTVYANAQGKFDDIINGGEGHDHVLFQGYGSDPAKGALRENQFGVYVDLAQGKAWDSFTTYSGILGVTDIAQVDQSSLSASYASLQNIEGIDGTNGADVLIGNDADNSFFGSIGNDYIDGGAGYADTAYLGIFAGDQVTLKLNSDASFDSFITYGDANHTRDHDHFVHVEVFDAGYDGWNNAIDLSGLSGTSLNAIFDLNQGLITVYDLNPRKDFLSFAIRGIENAIGTQSGDDFQGSENDNHIYGNGGDDHIYGNGGNDILVGGDGRDTLVGGDGQDILVGGAGNDVLDGGQGHDVIDLTGSNGGHDIVRIVSTLDVGDVIKGFGTAAGSEADILDLDSFFDRIAPTSNAVQRASMLEVHQTAGGIDLLLHQQSGQTLLLAQFQGLAQQDAVNLQNDLEHQTQNLIRLAHA